MSEKPKKRLVSKGRYVWLMTGKTTLLAASVCSFLIGGYWSFIMLILTYWKLSDWKSTNILEIFCFTVGMLCAIVPLCLGRYLLKKGQAVERVTPITRHTTSSLPPEESLVRASDASPSHQQAELLRATQHCKETPAEELLRASTDSKSE